MWDDHVALNRLSKLILLATLAFVAWVAGRAVLEQAFPFREVTVHGAQHADTRAGARQLTSRLNGGFFSMDLQAVRDEFMKLPWVRRADVHRLWPGRLVVSLEEHRAEAAWNDRYSLNTHGEVFAVEPRGNLPRIYAPDGMEKLLSRRYHEFNQTVAPLGMKVEQLVVSKRLSWRVRLSGDISIELGRERINERLARFTAVYPHALAAVGPLQRVDMRYPNGFAAKVDAHATPRDTQENKASKA
ncbi:MAG: cell division protein FtsQ/DivIB [Pseudomonadota bacterium]